MPRFGVKEKKGVLVLFLGRKGPGLTFARSIAEYLESINELSIIVTASKLSDYPSKNKFLNLRIPHSFLDLTDVLFFPIQFLKFMIAVARVRPRTLLVTMPSPSDLFFTKASRFYGVKTVRIIHDLNSHPGDLWPSKRAIKKRIDDTDLVCFLSETIHKIFLEGNHGRRNHDKPIIVLKHPVLPIKKNFKLIEVASGRPFLLIIGRMRSYKGVAEFLHIWVNRRSMLDHVLVIVGEGILETSVVEQARVRDDVIIENEWVDDARFYSYLKSSEVVVFPYIEATQSGIIPIAMDLNKVIVVNNVGALREQIAGYPNGLVIDHSKSAEFMMAELEQVVRSSVLISRKNFVKTTLNMEEFSAQLCSILLKI